MTLPSKVNQVWMCIQWFLFLEVQICSMVREIVNKVDFNRGAFLDGCLGEDTQT